MTKYSVLSQAPITVESNMYEVVTVQFSRENIYNQNFCGMACHASSGVELEHQKLIPSVRGARRVRLVVREG